MIRFYVVIRFERIRMYFFYVEEGKEELLIILF